MAKEAIFQSMGIRSKKAVSPHPPPPHTPLFFFLENAYKSNLLQDIANVDYLAGDLNRTNLQPLNDLSPFVDVCNCSEIRQNFLHNRRKRQG